MKVLHICTSDSGGAGLCCIRIHRALLDRNVDSKVLVLNKSTDQPQVYHCGTFRTLCRRILHRALRTLGLRLTHYDKVMALNIDTKRCFTLPTSWVDLSANQLVKDADIIHLHWVGHYLDYQTFFAKVKKPIVWTLHDENLFLGIAHYSKDKALGGDIEEYYYRLKLKAINGASRLGIVFLSDMMSSKFRNHDMIRGRESVVINNSVDYNKFCPQSKAEARKHFGIDSNCIVLIFVAAVISDPRKGLAALKSVVGRLNNPDIKVLAVGGKMEGDDVPDYMIAPGPFHTPEDMSRAYSCADYFVMPSYQEAFAQTPLEAMACGVPVVAFPVSGTAELINSENGVICSDFTEEALYDGIAEALKVQYNSEAIRADVVKRFSPEAMAEKYVRFYRRLLANEG